VGTTGIIDQSLMSLDEKLETVTKGMKSVNESVEPLIQSAPTPTPVENGDSDERTLLLRKHATLVTEWESVQDESDVLREELKEDKWLTVFRTVTEQADGMMSSLEKAVNRCQVRGSYTSENHHLIMYLAGFHLASPSVWAR
jgi:Yeast cortical protein KAR9